MSCSEFDVRDYFLGELPEAERGRAERHLAGCADCAAELGEWQHLRLALESVPDQEPPQRIGFVSDQVFEPSGAMRLWRGFWRSGPQLGFASAAMLSAAAVVVALHPTPAVRTVEKAVPVVTAERAPDPQPLIEEAVRRAVAESEARQQKRTDALLALSERKYHDRERALMLSVADSFTMLQKRALVNRASLVTYGGEGQ